MRLLVALVIGCSSAPAPVAQNPEGPSAVCLSARPMRARARAELAAGHLRRAESIASCADKRCPSEPASDVMKAVADGLGRGRKADLGAALAATPEIAVDMLGRLGAGAPRVRGVRVATSTALGVANGRIVLDGEGEALVYDPKTWAPRIAVAAKRWQVSPDGQTLATADDKETRLHDPLTAASATFPAGELTFSDDSQRVAIATASAVTIVTLANRRVERTLTVTALPVVQFAGKALVMRCENGDLSVVDLGTGKTVLSRPSVLDYAITEDDKRLAWVASIAGALEVAYVDLATFATVQAVKTTLPLANAPRVAITEDGRTIAVTNGKHAVVMDGKSGTARTLPPRAGGDFGVNAAYFDRDGFRLCGSFAREGELCAWDTRLNVTIKSPHFVARKRMVEAKLKGALPNVNTGSARVSNGALLEQTFAVVEKDGKKLSLVLMDLAKPGPVGRVSIGEADFVSSLVVEAAAEVFVVRFDGKDFVVDPKTRALLATLDDASGAPVRVGEQLVFPAARGGVVVVHRTTGEKKTLLLSEQTEVCAVGPHLVGRAGCEELVACP